MKTIAWMVLMIVATGCGNKDDDSKAKATEPAPAPAAKPDPAPAPAAAPVITPREGESFGGDLGVDGENPVSWKTRDGGAALIGVLVPDGPDGETARVVVAAVGADGKVTETEVATVPINMAYGHGVDVEVGADGKALLRVSETGGSSDPGYLAAWRLAWDAAAKKAVVEEHGLWDGLTDPPAWAARKPEQ